MTLKHLVREQKLLESGAVDAELVLHGEPMIYSVKYTLGSRTYSTQFFRNMKWKSLLKSFFRSYYSTKTSVVLMVRFYVSPPPSIHVSVNDLKNESVPAVFSYELADYLLSFQEMLMHVLINSYRQIVKIETEKFYSADPRTVFKFMRWDQYVKLYNNNPLHPESKGISTSGGEGMLQPKCEGDEQNKAVCKKIVQREGNSVIKRPTSCHSPLPHPSLPRITWKKKATAAFNTSRKKT